MPKATSSSKYNFIHGSFLAMNLIGFAWYCSLISDFNYLIKYFSMQAYELGIVYSFVSMIPSSRNSKICQILYEISFTSNLIAFLGYWIMIRNHIVDKIPFEFTLCNDFTHTIPIVMLVVIHYVEKLEYFHAKNLKYQVYLMIFASAVNVFYSLNEKPVYHFMTYKDAGTIFFLLGGCAVLILIFLSMMKITSWRAQSTLKTQ